MTARDAVVRVVRLLVVVALVSLCTALLMELVPGDPAAVVLGDSATPERVAQLRAELGLDQPFHVRFGRFVGNAVRGDLGRSILPPVRSVSELVAARLPVTIELTLIAMAMAAVTAVGVSLVSARYRGSAADTVISGASFAAVSVPNFLVALGLIYLVVFNHDLLRIALSLLLVVGALALALVAFRRWQRGDRRPAMWTLIVALVLLLLAGAAYGLLPRFPRQGYGRLASVGLIGNLRSVFLPALTLALMEGAVFTRVLRSDLIDTLDEDFVMAARARGRRPWSVLLHESLKPSSLSVVTLAGVAFGRLLGGTMVVETIFRLPGMGSLLVDAVQTKDYPVVQGTVLVLTVLFVLVTAAVDFSYRFLDPRLRHG